MSSRQSAQNFAKLEAAFNQVIKATTQRIDFLTVDVKNLEDLLAKGLTTRRTFEERRRDLTDAQQRKEDTQNEILKLRSQQTDLETQRERESQTSEFALNDARRQMDAAAGQLTQNTQIISPIEGRVLEIKISAGAVLAVGTPVIAIESEGTEARGADLHSGRARQEREARDAGPHRAEHGEARGVRNHGRHRRDDLRFPDNAAGHGRGTPQRQSGHAAFRRKVRAYAATVSLEQDPETVSGYRWAVGKGPPIRLTSGTLTRAEITTRRQRPLDLVVPLFRRLTGIDG